MPNPTPDRPICAHLRPLADAIIAAGINLVPTTSPYGGDATWWRCECTFDAEALRKRLALDPCVKYFEYHGMSAGSDSTFNCTADHIVFIGPHPSFAGDDTPRLK